MNNAEQTPSNPRTVNLFRFESKYPDPPSIRFSLSIVGALRNAAGPLLRVYSVDEASTFDLYFSSLCVLRTGGTPRIQVAEYDCTETLTRFVQAESYFARKFAEPAIQISDEEFSVQKPTAVLRDRVFATRRTWADNDRRKAQELNLPKLREGQLCYRSRTARALAVLEHALNGPALAYDTAGYIFFEHASYPCDEERLDQTPCVDGTKVTVHQKAVKETFLLSQMSEVPDEFKKVRCFSV